MIKKNKSFSFGQPSTFPTGPHLKFARLAPGRQNSPRLNRPLPASLPSPSDHHEPSGLPMISLTPSSGEASRWGEGTEGSVRCSHCTSLFEPAECDSNGDLLTEPAPVIGNLQNPGHTSRFPTGLCASMRYFSAYFATLKLCR
jgi:hypothetical protein